MSFGANIVVGGDIDRVGRLGSGRLDHPFMPLKTVPYIKGMLLEVPGMIGTFDQVFIPPFDIELASVAVGASTYQPRDSWSLFIGEDSYPNTYIFDEIYTKDLPEGAYLMAVREVKQGVPITFRFSNEGGKAKYVWVNYQCLRDEGE